MAFSALRLLCCFLDRPLAGVHARCLLARGADRPFRSAAPHPGARSASIKPRYQVCSVQSTPTQQLPSPEQPLIGCPGQAGCRGHIPPMDRRSGAGPPRWTSGEATNSRRSRTWVNPPGENPPVGPPRPPPASHAPPRLEVMPDDRRARSRTGAARRAAPASLIDREVALRPL